MKNISSNGEGKEKWEKICKYVKVSLSSISIEEAVFSKEEERMFSQFERTRLSSFLKNADDIEIDNIGRKIQEILSQPKVQQTLKSLYEDVKVKDKLKKQKRVIFIALSAIAYFLYFYFNKKNKYPTVTVLCARQGVGKTWIAILLIRFSIEFNLLKEENTRILVHRRNLKNQWLKRLESSSISNVKTLTLQKLGKIKNLDLTMNLESSAFIFDEAQTLTKNSGRGFLLTRYIRKHRKIFELAPLLFFILPSSEDMGRVKKLIRTIKKVKPNINPVLLQFNNNIFEYEVIENLVSATPLRRKIFNYIQLKRRRIKKMTSGILHRNKLPLPLKFDKIAQEDIDKYKKILRERNYEESKIENVIEELCSLIKIYRSYGSQLKMYLLNGVLDQNVLISDRIKVAGIPLFEYFGYFDILKKVVEIVRKIPLEEKILIFTSYVLDIKRVKEYLEENLGEEIQVVEEGRPENRIVVITEKNADGVDFSDYQNIILFRYPRKSISKIENICQRIRGGKIYLINLDFEKPLADIIKKKINGGEENE
jgi:hypothetical protein